VLGRCTRWASWYDPGCKGLGTHPAHGQQQNVSSCILPTCMQLCGWIFLRVTESREYIKRTGQVYQLTIPELPSLLADARL
jgi:hypothetical protein